MIKRHGEADFEADITAVDGNVHIEMTFGDDMRVAFSASPRKVRHLAKVMLNVCDEADADLPSI